MDLFRAAAPLAAISLVAAFSGEKAIRLEAGCDFEVDVAPAGVLTFEISEPVAAGWLEIEQLGIDVVLEAGGGRVDAPTGDWGIEVLLPEGAGLVQIRALDPRDSAGRIRLRCRDLPEEGEERAFLESLAAAGREPGEPSARLETYRRLAFSPVAVEPLWRLESALAAARLAQQAGDLAAAEAALAKALAAAEKLESRPWLLAAALNLKGLVDHLSGRSDPAEAALGRSLEIWQRLGRGPDMAAALQNLGLLALQRGDPERALEHFRRGLDLLVAPAEPAKRLELHGGAGGALDRLGQLRPAIGHYRSALELARQLADSRAQARQLSNAAISHLALGEWQNAIEALEEADSLLQSGEDPQLLGSVRNNIGYTYLSLGDGRAAVRAFEAALLLRRRAGDRRGELITLNNLGRARRLLGKVEAARENHRKALAIAESLADPRQQVISRLRLAESWLAGGNAAKSLEELALARQVNEKVEVRLRADLLRTEARALLLAGRLDAAAVATEAALAAARDSEDRLARIEGDLLVAEIARQQGRHQDAVTAARGAALEVEAQREKLVSVELRARFLSVQREAFVLWIDSALALGDPQTALEVAERARTRTLLDVLATAQTLPFLSFQQMQAMLDAETALLELSLGPRQSNAFLLTTGGLESFSLPGEAELDALVRAAIAEQNVARPGGPEATPSGERLARLLLAPFSTRLAPLRRLVVVPDGRFATLSWAALPDPAAPGQLMIDRFEIAYLPSLAVLASQRRLAAGRKLPPNFLAVVADPVFSADDPRLPQPSRDPRGAGAPPPADRLPASREEAAAILALAQDGRSFVDFAAAKDRFLGGDLAGFRYLHVATHGQVDSRLEERTGLLLSAFDAGGRRQDSWLGLKDIYRLELAADLVVLSACESAVGEEIRGEGLLSLSRAFLFAGVPKVAATLWLIPDAAAQRLMPAFYRELWQEGRAPAAALRQAQLQLRSQRRFRQPFYWAGFVYFGDWRSN